MKGLSEELLISAMQAVIKNDKFTVTAAEPTDDGAGIHFEAKSKSGQVRIKGLFCEPQQSLDLEPPAENVELAPSEEEAAANEDEDDDKPH